MTTLERACIAIVEALRAQGDLYEDCGEPKYAQVDGSFRVEPLARAVLEAIREADEAEVSKVVEGTETVVAWGDYGEFWRAMIDAVLAQSGPREPA